MSTHGEDPAPAQPGRDQEASRIAPGRSRAAWKLWQSASSERNGWAARSPMMDSENDDNDDDVLATLRVCQQ